MIDKTLWSQPSNFYWAVGLFEGEGSFNYSAPITGRDAGRVSLRASINMTDEDVIIKFSKIIGFGNMNSRVETGHRKDGSPYKPAWVWKSGNQTDILEFEKSFFPHLSIKKKRDILRTHELRRNYELSASGPNLRRIFTTNSGELLPYSEVFRI